MPTWSFRRIGIARQTLPGDLWTGVWKSARIACLALCLSLSSSPAVELLLLPPDERDSPAHQEALTLLRKNAFAEARAAAWELLEKDAGDMRARLLVALAWLGEGGEKECWESLELARVQDPSGSAALYGTVGEVFAANRRVHRAIQYLETSVSLAEDRARSLQLADLYLGQGRFDEARRLYAKYPDVAAARLQLARIALVQHDYEEAVEQAERAVAAENAPPGATLVLASAQLCRDDLEAAEKAFRQCVEREVAPQQAAYSRGMIALISEDYPTAAEHFAEAPPEAVQTRLALAVLAQSRGELTEAFDRATDAVRPNPQDPVCQFILGNITCQKGDMKNATDAFRAAAALSADFARSDFSSIALAETTPKEAWAPLSLLALCFREGLYTRALALAEAEAVRKTGHPLAAAWKARALSALGEHAAARDFSESTAKRFPEWLLPVQLLAETAAAAGRHAEAAGHYRNLLEKEPDSARLTLLLGEQLILANQFDAALQVYVRATERNPEDGLALNQRAWILSEKKGHHEQALPLARASVAASPNQPAARDTLAWIHFHLGQPDQALETYRPLLDRPLNDPATNYHIGCVQQALGETAEAASRLEAALNQSATFDGADDAVRRLKEVAGW